MRNDFLQNDFNAGFRDRCVGIYDKWYHHNRLDEGAAYNRGQKEAVDTVGDHLPDAIQVVEMMVPAVI